MQWQDCPPSPLAWFELRQPLLTLLLTPGLLLPLVGAFALILAWWWQLPRLALPAVALLAPLTLSVIYSPLATALLSGWLMAQVPPLRTGGRGPARCRAGGPWFCHRRRDDRGCRWPASPRPGGSGLWFRR
jgi:hypothetical protein